MQALLLNSGDWDALLDRINTSFNYPDSVTGTETYAEKTESETPGLYIMPIVDVGTGGIMANPQTNILTENEIAQITSDSETIDGATTLALASQYDRVTIISDGTEWHVID